MGMSKLTLAIFMMRLKVHSKEGAGSYALAGIARTARRGGVSTGVFVFDVAHF